MHGGSRSRYTGRDVRHEPVLLARLEPGLSVIAPTMALPDCAVPKFNSAAAAASILAEIVG